MSFALDWWPYMPDGWLVSTSPGPSPGIDAVQNLHDNLPPGYWDHCPTTYPGQSVEQVNVAIPSGNPDVQLDGICRWTKFHDPGQITQHGWSTAVPTRAEFDGGPRLMKLELDVKPELHFEPKLFFDKGEKFRPLNIDTFLNEKDTINHQPVQCVGTSWNDCTPVNGIATLRQHHDPSDRIIQGNWQYGGPASTTADYATENTTCNREPYRAEYELQDCDEGPDSVIYANTLERSAGYNYFDYWFFYRYNPFFGDNHQADWEEVTVAQSLTDPDTFDWVQFHEHTYATGYSSTDGGLGGSYLRANLSCDDGGPGSCGSDQQGAAGEASDPHGHRVWVYVAGGSHASYPIECDNACVQPAIWTLEGDHGGQVPWGNNDSPSALIKFPAAVGWLDPNQGNWTDWPGKWGEEGTPASPGTHSQFGCPWIGNPDDATACSARSHAVARSSALTREASACGAWYGDSVIAAACSPAALRTSAQKGRLGRRGTARIVVHGSRRRSASAPGIAQAVGRNLRPGETIVLSGRRTADTQLMVRAQYGRRIKQWVLVAGLGGNGRLVVRVPARADQRPVLTKGVSEWCSTACSRR